MSSGPEKFEPSKQPDQQPTNWPLLILLAVACAAGAAIGWYFPGMLLYARGIDFAIVIMPLLAGTLSGLVMMQLGSDLRQPGCIAACVATGVGCILGDQIYTIYFQTQYQNNTLGVLYGDQLIATLNTTFNITKAILIAIAVWLTYILTKPRTYEPQIATG